MKDNRVEQLPIQSFVGGLSTLWMSLEVKKKYYDAGINNRT